MEFFKEATQAFSDQGANTASPVQPGDRALPFKLPGFVTNAIDSYLDGLKPELSPLVANEISQFQKMSLDELEAKVHLVFQQIFHGDFSAFHSDDATNANASVNGGAQGAPAQGFGGGGYGNQAPVNNGGYSNQAPVNNGGYANPQQGGGGYGYANQTPVSNGGYDATVPASRDLLSPVTRDPRDPITGPTDRGIISDALHSVTAFAEQTQNSLSSAIDPRAKADALIPELRAKLDVLLTEKHRGLADGFSHDAIEQFKTYLHGNISPREVGGAGVEDAVGTLKGFFGGNKENHDSTDRGLALPQGAASGLTSLLSTKIAEGLAIVKRMLHQTLHQNLVQIEQALFAELPAHIRGPLQSVFGGAADAATGGQRGLVADIEDKLLNVVKGLSEGLQEKARGVVVEGHRRLEDSVVDRAQDVVVGRVRKYLPNAQF
ncbi:hypothetical protein HKX48_003140 [Thoreauomyces humboldtii]|nr:hypothetical protein HKX48_003140 [Thoreauomyces humboldtii]